MKQDYSAAWIHYRKLRRDFLVAWLSGLFLIAASGLAAPVLNMTGGETIAAVVGATWISAFLFTLFRMQMFRCPRCGKSFFKGFWYYNPFTRHCINCGVERK